jgi:hypothetical protein
MEAPPLLLGLQWAAMAGGLLALYFLLFDFMVWWRARNDRKNQID